MLNVKLAKRGLLVGAAFIGASAAEAQETSARVAAEQDESLADIIVTATRRETRLLDTPIAVTAFGAENLADRNVSRLEDLAGFIPGTYVDERNLRTQTIAIRGLSADLNNPGLDQSVGIYVDGVYLGRAAPGNASLFDLERIEVLRGPQGALYGKNTIAGAVNYVTRLPDEELRGSMEAGYGNHNAWQLRGALSGPLAPGVAAGIAASFDRRDGFVFNDATGVRQDDIHAFALRSSLRLQASADLAVVLRGDFSRDRTNSGSADVLFNGAFTGTPLADANPYDREVSQDVDPVQDRDVWGVSGQVDLRLGEGTLTSLTALRGFTWHNFADNDYTTRDMLSSGIDEDQEQFSQELRFAGEAGALRYMAGLYYFRQSLETQSLAIIGTDLGVYPTRVRTEVNGDVETQSYAAFVHGDYALSSMVSLTAGLRYTSESKELTHSQQGDPFGLLLGTYGQRRLERSEDDFSPSASLNFKPAPDILLYASYARGFKSGGFNVFSVTPINDARYAPEHVDSFELGLKASLFEGRGRLAVNAFRMDYSNLQVNQLINVNGVPRFTTSNAASARSRGLEAELAFRPLRDLDITATYAYLDAQFVDYENATGAGADYTGNSLARAPEHSASLAAQFTAPVSAAVELFARGEGTARSRIYFGPDNAFSQGGLALFNARLGLRDTVRGWGIFAWSRNIGNRDYAISRSAGAIVPGQTIQSLGSPRTYGVELTFRF